MLQLRNLCALLSQVEEAGGASFVAEWSQMIKNSFQSGGKLLAAGNGGSYCEAMHLVEEFTGFFREKRPPLPAICLGDPAHLTCVANDVGYEHVFSRELEALGKPGDLFVGLTTSGNSPNLCRAFEMAQKQGIHTVALLGRGGGRLAGVADLEFCVPGCSTSDRIQEVHLLLIHSCVEEVEKLLFAATDLQREELLSSLAR